MEAAVGARRTSATVTVPLCASRPALRRPGGPASWSGAASSERAARRIEGRGQRREGDRRPGAREFHGADAAAVRLRSELPPDPGQLACRRGHSPSRGSTPRTGRPARHRSRDLRSGSGCRPREGGRRPSRAPRPRARRTRCPAPGRGELLGRLSAGVSITVGRGHLPGCVARITSDDPGCQGIRDGAPRRVLSVTEMSTSPTRRPSGPRRLRVPVLASRSAPMSARAPTTCIRLVAMAATLSAVDRASTSAPDASIRIERRRCWVGFLLGQERGERPARSARTDSEQLECHRHPLRSFPEFHTGSLLGVGKPEVTHCSRSGARDAPRYVRTSYRRMDHDGAGRRASVCADSPPRHLNRSPYPREGAPNGTRGPEPVRPRGSGRSHLLPVAASCRWPPSAPAPPRPAPCSRVHQSSPRRRPPGARLGRVVDDGRSRPAPGLRELAVLHRPPTGNVHPSLDLFTYTTGISGRLHAARPRQRLVPGEDPARARRRRADRLRHHRRDQRPAVSTMLDSEWLLPLDPARPRTVRREREPARPRPPWDPGNRFTAAWQSGLDRDRVPTRGGRGARAGADERPRSVGSGADGACGMFTDEMDLGSFGLLRSTPIPRTLASTSWSRAAAALRQQQTSGVVRGYYDQEYVRALQRGDIWISQAWSGDIFQANQLGHPELSFVLPDEGAMFWTDNMMIPVGAAHPRDAMSYIDFVYRPNVAAMIADWVWYISPVPAAKEIIRDTLRRSGDRGQRAGVPVRRDARGPASLGAAAPREQSRGGVGGQPGHPPLLRLPFAGRDHGVRAGTSAGSSPHVRTSRTDPEAPARRPSWRRGPLRFGVIRPS